MPDEEETIDQLPPQDDHSPADVASALTAQLQPGDRVGHYVIRERLGEGGFAVVYAADQREPVQRRVALKIIKLGMDTSQVVARFEAERQALAMMDHPHVARVFDAGATETGRPFFVMEFVAGTPITEYCDRHRLDVEQRLRLFMEVCEAIQHAHQKGIIHRDVKPSNVLVEIKEDTPHAKVIDFGVAKAISSRLAQHTVYTEQGQLIGTPEYMSPEQAEMTSENIDTRTDIYSLGVLLYELLTGSLPFEPQTLRSAAFAEMQRIIREQQPPRPSTKLSASTAETATIAEKRRSAARSLPRVLRGDLDWITMKALEKDRTRRYASASELAGDVARHLAGDPIEAAPPTVRYRLSRFIKKNITALNVICGSGLVVFMLLFGLPFVAMSAMGDDPGSLALIFTACAWLAIPPALVVMAIVLWWIRRSRLSWINLGLAGVLVTGVAAIFLLPRMWIPSTGELTDAPALERAGRYDEAAKAYEKALAEAPDNLNPRLITEWTVSLAGVYLKLERFEDSEALYLDELAGRRRRVMGSEVSAADILDSLVDLYNAWGRPDDARQHLVELLDIRRRAAEAPNAGPRTLNDYAWLLLTCEPVEFRDPAAALPLAERANERVAGKWTNVLDTLARAHYLNGNPEQAVEFQRQALSVLSERESPRWKSPLRGEYESRLAEYEAALPE